MKTSQYLTVQALTKYIKRKFDADPHLSEVLVKGEISNFKKHTSGHMYFTLKDEKSRMMAVMFSRSARTMKFTPENGMKVLVRASVTVYEASGQYQMYVREMQPDGIGELFLAYEQLKAKLEKEGLFHPDRKRSIPLYPQTIALVTSPTGAAIRDMITTINRRYPIAKILVIPALVQGENAPQSIANAVQFANKNGTADILIVGRGGGSIEELWAFNEEVVARAIFQSNIPIISAVGHETDVTIADFVADVRAATPTAAAELAVPHIEELLERLLNQKGRLFRSMNEIISKKRSEVEALERSYIFRYPQKLYEQKWENLDRLTEKLHTRQGMFFSQKKEQFETLQTSLARNHPAHKLQLSTERYLTAKHRLLQQIKVIVREKTNEFTGRVATLEALSPLGILRRGFSVAYNEDGELIKSVKQGTPGNKLKLKVTDGELFCTINHIEEGEKSDE